MPTGIYTRSRRTVHIKIECEVCKVVFEVPPSRKNLRKRCSVVCYRKSQFGNKNALGPHKKYGSRPERNRQQSLRQGDGRCKKEKHPRWNPDRKEQFAKQRTRYLHRSLLYRMIKEMGGKKEGHTKDILGFTAEEFRRHIESLFDTNMTWENHGNGPNDWSIDHIRPLCSFSLDTPASIVNSLSNIRPLWHSENLRRTRKWNG